MVGGLLAVCSSLVYGTSDFLGGVASRHVRTLTVLWISHLSALVLLAGLGVLIVLGDGLYAVATNHGILGVVAVLSSLYPIITVALTRIVLDEQIRTKQWIGVVVAVAGVAAVSSTAVR